MRRCTVWIEDWSVERSRSRLNSRLVEHKFIIYGYLNSVMGLQLLKEYRLNLCICVIVYRTVLFIKETHFACRTLFIIPTGSWNKVARRTVNMTIVIEMHVTVSQKKFMFVQQALFMVDYLEKPFRTGRYGDLIKQYEVPLWRMLNNIL